jgi:hypothetical protein
MKYSIIPGSIQAAEINTENKQILCVIAMPANPTLSQLSQAICKAVLQNTGFHPALTGQITQEDF